MASSKIEKPLKLDQNAFCVLYENYAKRMENKEEVNEKAFKMCLSEMSFEELNLSPCDHLFDYVDKSRRKMATKKDFFHFLMVHVVSQVEFGFRSIQACYDNPFRIDVSLDEFDAARNLASETLLKLHRVSQRPIHPVYVRRPYPISKGLIVPMMQCNALMMREGIKFFVNVEVTMMWEQK